MTLAQPLLILGTGAFAEEVADQATRAAKESAREHGSELRDSVTQQDEDITPPSTTAPVTPTVPPTTTTF